MSEITQLNHAALAEVLRTLEDSTAQRIADVLLLSPSLDDVAFVRGHLPQARLFVATRSTWDLNEPFPSAAGVDLVIASNVFHYSPNPELWFHNVLKMTRFLLLQDLIFRRRSASPSGLCDDGDKVRYCLRARGITSEFAAAYDLSALDSRISAFKEFAGGRNEYHAPPLPAPRHYCALFAPLDQSQPRPKLGGGAYLKYRLPAVSCALRLALRGGKRAAS